MLRTAKRSPDGAKASMTFMMHGLCRLLISFGPLSFVLGSWPRFRNPRGCSFGASDWKEDRTAADDR